MSKQYTVPDDLLTLTFFAENLAFLLATQRYKKLQTFITFQAHHVFSCPLNTTGPYPQYINPVYTRPSSKDFNIYP